MILVKQQLILEQANCNHSRPCRAWESIYEFDIVCLRDSSIFSKPDDLKYKRIDVVQLDDIKYPLISSNVSFFVYNGYHGECWTEE